MPSHEQNCMPYAIVSLGTISTQEDIKNIISIMVLKGTSKPGHYDGSRDMWPGVRGAGSDVERLQVSDEQQTYISYILCIYSIGSRHIHILYIYIYTHEH